MSRPITRDGVGTKKSTETDKTKNSKKVENLISLIERKSTTKPVNVDLASNKRTPIVASQLVRNKYSALLKSQSKEVLNKEKKRTISKEETLIERKRLKRLAAQSTSLDSETSQKRPSLKPSRINTTTDTKTQVIEKHKNSKNNSASEKSLYNKLKETPKLEFVQEKMHELNSYSSSETQLKITKPKTNLLQLSEVPDEFRNKDVSCSSDIESKTYEQRNIDSSIADASSDNGNISRKVMRKKVSKEFILSSEYSDSPSQSLDQSRKNNAMKPSLLQTTTNHDPRIATMIAKISSVRPSGLQLKTLRNCFEEAFGSPDQIKSKDIPPSDPIRNLKSYSKNAARFKLIRPKLLRCLTVRKILRRQRQYELSKNFKKIHDCWKGRSIHIDSSVRRKTRHRGYEQSPDDYSQHRVNTKFSFHTGDVVRSEKEFLETLQSLASAENCNQDSTDQTTSARIINMIGDPVERSLFPMNNSNGQISNPKEYFLGKAAADQWSAKEEKIFLKAFLKFPKQFGKISEFLTEKSTPQCVLYYYRNKYTRNLNGLLDEKTSVEGSKSQNKAAFSLNKRQGKSHVSKFKASKSKQDKEVAGTSFKTPATIPNRDPSIIDNTDEPVSSSSFVSLKEAADLDDQAESVDMNETPVPEASSGSETDILSITQEDEDTPQNYSTHPSPKPNNVSPKETVANVTTEIEQQLPNEEAPVARITSPLEDKSAVGDDTLQPSIKEKTPEKPTVEVEIPKPEVPVSDKPATPRGAKINALLNSPTSTHEPKQWDKTAILEWFGESNQEPNADVVDPSSTSVNVIQDGSFPNEVPATSKPPTFNENPTTLNTRNEIDDNKATVPTNKPSSTYLIPSNPKNESATNSHYVNPPNSSNAMFPGPHPSVRPNEGLGLAPRDFGMSSTQSAVLFAQGPPQKGNRHTKPRDVPGSYPNKINVSRRPSLASMYSNSNYPDSFEYQHMVRPSHLTSRALPNPGHFVRDPHKDIPYQYMRPQPPRDSRFVELDHSRQYSRDSNMADFNLRSDRLPNQFHIHRPVINTHPNVHSDRAPMFPFNEYDRVPRVVNGSERFVQSSTAANFPPGSMLPPESFGISGNNLSHANSQFVHQALLQKSLQDSQFEAPSHPHLLHRPIIQTSRNSLRAPTEPLPTMMNASGVYTPTSSVPDHLRYAQQPRPSPALSIPENALKQGSVPPRFDQANDFKKFH